MNSYLEDYSVKSICRGYARNKKEGRYTCLVCGQGFERGRVYEVDGDFYTASRAVRHHANTAHGNRFERLLFTDSKYNTLTAHQKALLQMLARGMSDAEIAASTGTTAATVRRQRFMFREKAKQAKMYLAIYEGLQEAKTPENEAFLPVHEGVRMLDDRFAITRQESEKIVKNAFSSTQPLRLKHLPVKEKKKVAVLQLIAGEFEKGKDYTEKQVNALLKAVYPDYVTLRRYLIEYGYMDRENDGSRYWVR